jgi:hypothetical protein
MEKSTIYQGYALPPSPHFRAESRGVPRGFNRRSEEALVSNTGNVAHDICIHPKSVSPCHGRSLVREDATDWLSVAANFALKPKWRKYASASPEIADAAEEGRRRILDVQASALLRAPHFVVLTASRHRSGARAPTCRNETSRTHRLTTQTSGAELVAAGTDATRRSWT